MNDRQHSHKAIFYAFLANLGIALATGWTALFTGSGRRMLNTPWTTV